MNLTSRHILVLLLPALAACSQGGADAPTAPESTVITVDFGAAGIEAWQEVRAARAGDMAADPIENAGVFAVNNVETDPVFDNRQFYSRATAPAALSWPLGNDWPYTPTKTWEPGADYVFVAYAPYYDSGVSVVRSDSGDDIGELVWEGLSSISASDHLLSTCVARTALGSGNIAVPLTMEHLMARLRFCFKLSDDYADLRVIDLKSMKVTYPDSRSMTLSVSFTNTGSGYTATHRWLRGEAGTGTTMVPLANEPGVTSITLAKGVDFQPLASVYYEPGDPLNMFNIEVEYDVYDLADHLLRSNDSAVSAITMMNTVAAGSYYDVRITVAPSYLYVLSDSEPDSDAALIIK